MKVIIVLAALVAVALSQNDPLAQPTPYSFKYDSMTEDGGSSGHQENGDGSGRVTGSYTVNDLEGHTRLIEYIADENGFRATVRTNEPGTANLNSADVKMESTGDDNGIAAAYAGTLSEGPAPTYARTIPAVPAPTYSRTIPARRPAPTYARTIPARRPAPAYARTFPVGPAPAVAPMTTGEGGSRYVLVPITDPRARGYY